MIGRTLNGIYRISELVGGGGFADVYLGRDLRTNTVVAIKVLHAHYARDPQIVQRFLQEAQTAQSLVEPHIVRVLDAGQDSGSYYIVMEYVQGHTLAHLIQTRGALPIQEAVEYTRQILQALEAAHRAGIVHRDIKPQNIMVTPEGTVKVMDFGIAKHAAAGKMTQTGMYLGTPQYMSPEQARGEKVDARSDPYSVAIVLYELLGGRPPFDAESPWQVLRLQTDVEAPSLERLRPGIPSWLAQVVTRGLAKEPAQRFQDAGDMLAALAGSTPLPRSIEVGQADRQRGHRPPVVASWPATPKPLGRWRLAVPVPLLAVGAAVLLLAGGLYGLSVRGQSGGGTGALTAAPRAIAGNGAAAALPTQEPVPALPGPPPTAPALTSAPTSVPVWTATLSAMSTPNPASGAAPASAWKVLAGHPPAPGQFGEPVAVAVDAQGNVYVADWRNQRIQKLSATGQPLAQWGGRPSPFAGSNPGQFQDPMGVAVDMQGNVYVADTSNHRIQKLSLAGQPLAQWGSRGSAPGQFNYPKGVTVDAQGSVYVADSGNNRVQVLPLGQQRQGNSRT